MSPARRLAVLSCIAVSIVVALLWQRTLPARPAGTAPGREVAAAMVPQSPSAVAGAANASPVQEPAVGQALCFGERGVVTLDEIPAGRFRRALERLTPEAREQAMRQLGDQKVPRNDVASLHVDQRGRLSYRCAPPGADSAVDDELPAAVRERAAGQPQAASVPISAPPIRHSKAGAPNVIYLDFNGHTITGTVWNKEDGTVGEDDYTPAVASYVAKAYSTDGDAANFSDAEQTAIVGVWSRVAEDYAPFDVDVTTEAPAVFSNKVVHVLITARKAKDAGNADVDMPGGTTAGGVSFLNVFGRSDFAELSPALVYYDALPPSSGFYGPASIASIASHEAGHYLSLSHDGTASEEYYSGHGFGAISWGPIMGTTYNRAMSQWSKGEYYQANNTEDDLALLANKLGYRYPGGEPDDRANTNATATPLTATGSSYSGSGMMDHPGDYDRFSFTTTGGSLTFTLKSYLPGGAADGTNLDVAVELYSSADILVNADNENSPAVTFTTGVNPGTYYLIVKAYGTGDPWNTSGSGPTGYTNYGSLGEYTITGSVAPAEPPVINYQPSATTVIMGQTVYLSTYAYGVPAPTFRWQRLPAGSSTWVDLSDNATYAGTGTTSLSIYASSLAANNDQFRCIVTNIGGSVTSNAATLSVLAATPPSISSNPYSTSTTVGTAAAMNCNASYLSSAPLTYRWERLPAAGGGWTALTEGTEYSGAAGSYLTINHPTLAMNGDKFRCVVTNIAGSATTLEAVLSVSPVQPPAITGMPTTVTVPYGEGFNFSLSISGTYPITFQWYKDGNVIAGATSSYFSKYQSTQADSGSYTLVATNAAGSVTSSAAVVTVNAVIPPAIGVQPKSAEVAKGRYLQVGVDPTGSQPMQFQWSKNGNAIPGATSSYYYLNSVTLADAGDYTVRVSNPGGAVTSAAATIAVLPAELPRVYDYSWNYPIYLQEGSGSNYLSFSANVESAVPVSYQWFKDGVAIPGATGSSYYQSAVTSAAAGVYSLLATNEAGVVMSPEQWVNWIPSADNAPWIDAVQQGDIVYFLAKVPGRILRYNLTTEAWLPIVYLAEAKAPTAFLPTAEGVFIAYDKELVRRKLDLTGEVAVATSTVTIRTLFSVGAYIYYRDDSTVRSRDRSTLAAGPMSSPANYASMLGNPVRPAYAPATGRLFASDNTNWSARIARFGVSNDGVVNYSSVTPNDNFVVGPRQFLSADESLVYDSRGAIFGADDLKYRGAVGRSFDDLVLLENGTPVVLRGDQLMAHGGSGFVETARFQLGTAGKCLFRRAANLYVFSAPTAGTAVPALAKVPVSALAAAAVPVAGSPFGRKFSIENCFVDHRGIVHLVSRSERGIVRWNATERTFEPTLPLHGAPQRSDYVWAMDRLVSTYSDGSVADSFPSTDSTEQIFASLPNTNPVLAPLAMNELTFLKAQSGSSSGAITLVLGAAGESLPVVDSYYWSSLRQPRLWNSAKRRIYLQSDYGSGNKYQFYLADIPTTGLLPEMPTGTTDYLWPTPFLASADGELILAGSEVRNSSLALLGTLGNAVADGVWQPDSLYTIRVRPTGTEVQRWARFTYEKNGSVTVPGIPLRIFRTNDDTLVVVTLVDGYVAFHLLNTALEVQASVVNNAAYIPARPALFDATAYLARSADVAASIGNPPDRAQQAWEHYWKNGIAEGRTDGDFSVQAYLTQYPTLAAQFGTNLQAAALHWYTVGRAQGLRIPAGFDVAGYFARNADIAALFAKDKYGAWLHYYNYGLFESRSFDANFIPAEYLELNPDLKASFGSNWQAAVMHWFNYGHPIEDRMGRVPIGFNVDSYLARYPDLAAAFGGITPKALRNVTVWHHYIAYGTLEGRSDGDFEAYNYLATNSDLAAVFGSDIQSAALHWYFYGRREGRRIPSAFKVQNYRSLYPDIVVVYGDDLYGSWLHYRDQGVYEGRVYDDLFRPAEYLALNPDIAAVIGSNNYRDALLHWLFYGKAEGRRGRY